MDPNEKLSLKHRTMRRIRRRREVSPLWYLGAAVLLIGLCVLLKFLPEKAGKAYDGMAGTGRYTAVFTGNINVIGLIAALAVLGLIGWLLFRPYKEATKLEIREAKTLK